MKQKAVEIQNQLNSPDPEKISAGLDALRRKPALPESFRQDVLRLYASNMSAKLPDFRLIGLIASNPCTEFEATFLSFFSSEHDLSRSHAIESIARWNAYSTDFTRQRIGPLLLEQTEKESDPWIRLRATIQFARFCRNDYWRKAAALILKEERTSEAASFRSQLEEWVESTEREEFRPLDQCLSNLGSDPIFFDRS